MASYSDHVGTADQRRIDEHVHLLGHPMARIDCRYLARRALHHIHGRPRHSRTKTRLALCVVHGLDTIRVGQ